MASKRHMPDFSTPTFAISTLQFKHTISAMITIQLNKGAKFAEKSSHIGVNNWTNVFYLCTATVGGFIRSRSMVDPSLPVAIVLPFVSVFWGAVGSLVALRKSLVI